MLADLRLLDNLQRFAISPTGQSMSIYGDPAYPLRVHLQAPAPLYFTKLLKPVVALLRRLGLRIIVYLDDIIVFNQTREKILRDRDSTLWLLQNLGFVINWKKSVLDPSHCMEYLGFVINSLEMNLSLPKEKMNQLIQSCGDLIREKTASVRTLAKIIGKLTSSMQAVLPAPLHY